LKEFFGHCSYHNARTNALLFSILKMLLTGSNCFHEISGCFYSFFACFLSLASPRNLPSQVKYYGKFESFGKEFRWTKFIAVEKITARSVEDETRNAELNGNRNPEWWGDFSQPIKIETIKLLGISRYKVELRFALDLNSEVSRGTNSN